MAMLASSAWRAYAVKQGDSPGVVHRMKDSMSALETLSKVLTAHLEKIQAEERRAPALSEEDTALLVGALAAQEGSVQRALDAQTRDFPV